MWDSLDTDRFFAWVKDSGHKLYIADIVYAELYTGIHLSQSPALEGKRIERFLTVNDVEVKHISPQIEKRAGELYAKHLLKKKVNFDKKEKISKIIVDTDLR